MSCGQSHLSYLHLHKLIVDAHKPPTAPISHYMDFVFVSLQRINTDRESTSTNLARELAKQRHNVLYVNSPIDRKEFYSKAISQDKHEHVNIIKTKTSPIQQLAPHLWVLNPVQLLDSFNWIPSTLLFSQLIKINNNRLAKEIKSALEKLNFRDFVLINDKDIFRGFYLKELLFPYKYVYLDRDYTLGLTYWKRHGKSLEPALMRKSDAVLCNSLNFTARAKQYNPNSFYIGNGFDTTHFHDSNDVPIPTDLVSIPVPRIGYVGALIDLRLDLGLLIDLAQSRPEWSFVLIGWEDKAFADSILHTLPNVFFLGRKHTRDVPVYLNYFDVCINPQILNDITRSNFPLKVLEYLASGKPVVATVTNTMTEVFSDHTYLATNTESYLTQIEKALSENTVQQIQKRKNFVKEFSWENVVKLMLNHLNDLS
jgi:teichuronic acid biosynthesis glycosyltransferase TuaH